MIRGLYGAATALEAALLNQDVAADNLAHAATPGYRRHSVRFEALANAVAATQSGQAQGIRAGDNYTSFEAGPVQQTGNPLDLALSGNAFFVLEGPRGPVYTRNGSFEVNEQGELRNKSGLPVRGVGGPLVIPQGTAHITITREGAVLANNVEVGRLQLAQFPRFDVLRRAGTTLFEAPSPGEPPQPGTVRVEQGYREGSNVQVVHEMVSMLAGMRHYEAANRAMQALAESVGHNTRPQA